MLLAKHGHAAGGRLVDDLVERLARPRLRRAQERVRGREKPGQLGPRHRRLDADARTQDVRGRDRGLELAPVRALVVGELRASQLQLGVDP